MHEITIVDRFSLTRLLSKAIKEWHTTGKWEDIKGFLQITEDIHLIFSIKKRNDMFTVMEYGTNKDKKISPNKLEDIYLPPDKNRGSDPQALSKDITWFMCALAHIN